MKKILPIALILTLLAAYIANQPVTGDANNDGYVNLLDVTCVAADIGSAVPACAGSDVNGDGEVSEDDLELVRAKMN